MNDEPQAQFNVGPVRVRLWRDMNQFEDPLDLRLTIDRKQNGNLRETYVDVLHGEDAIPAILCLKKAAKYIDGWTKQQARETSKSIPVPYPERLP